MPDAPTLIIPPPSTLPATTDPQYSPSFSGDEIDFLEVVLKFFQLNYSYWNSTPAETARFNTVLAKIQNFQLQAPVNQRLTSATVATASIAPGNTEAIEILWPVAFSDNTYVIAYSLQDDSGFLRINNYSYLANGTGILIRVTNTDADANHQGVVNVIAYLP